MLQRIGWKSVSKAVTHSSPIYLKAAPTIRFDGKINYFHSSRKVENELVVGGLAAVTVAVSLQYALKAYNSIAQKNAVKKDENNSDAEGTTVKSKAEEEKEESSTHQTNNRHDSTEDVAFNATAEAKRAEAKKNPNASTEAGAQQATEGGGIKGILDSWSKWWNARQFQEGGFEDKMSRLEAAKILGVKEYSSPEKIKEAHRKIMQINHPDKGGSAYITAKVNEAKDLLLKGK